MDHLKHVSAVVFEIQPLLVKDLECYIYVTLGFYFSVDFFFILSVFLLNNSFFPVYFIFHNIYQNFLKYSRGV